MIAGRKRLTNIRVKGVHSPLTSYYVTLSGGFLFNCNDNVEFRLKNLFEKASTNFPNKQIVLDYIHEPIVFLNRNHIHSEKELSWFEFLHDLSAKLNFNIENITLLTSNIYSEKTYNNWCINKSISKKMNVKNQSERFWLAKLIDSGYNKSSTIADKKMSLFIGRPNFQKNIIVKWYLDTINNSMFEQDVVSTFLYDNFIPSASLNIDAEKLKELPGSFETGKQSHPTVTLPWGGNSTEFSSYFSKGLFNFTIDYLEHEDFDKYSDYLKFKEKNAWWEEDMISEKTFKCVVLKRPFIRLGMPHSLKRFKEWGFKTFDGVLFDESYDDIEDFYDRLDVILNQVNNTISMPFNELQEKIQSPAVQEVLDYNYNLAYKIYNEKKELVNV
jgi:hypothetical protein